MNLIYGFKASIDLLSFRWKTIRNAKTKIAITIAFIVVAFIIFGVTSIGKTMRTIASDPSATFGPAIKNFAVTYVGGFVDGNQNYAASSVLAAVIGSIIIIPIVGYSFSSLTPSGDLVSIRKNDYHKLSDSVILQLLSSISLIQLIALTGINSLLTIAANRPGIGIVFGWVIWLVVVLLTVFVAWFFELLYRIYGFKSKVIAISALIVIAGIVALLFWKKASTLFGLSNAYSSLIKGISDYTPSQTLLAWGAVLAAIALVGWGISRVGSRALNLPERPKRSKERRVFVVSVGKKKRTLSQSAFLLNIIFRNSNIWKPLTLAVAFSLGSVIILQGSAEVLSSLVFVLPLIVSLSWCVNTFGILGGGTTWLASLPGGKEDILKNIAKIQFLLIGSLFAVMFILSAFVFQVGWQTSSSFLIATATSTLIMTRSALSKAVYQPERYRVHIKGENVLPPAKALNYLGRFIGGGGLVGLVTFYIGNLGIQLGILAVVAVWQSIRFVRLNKQWVTKPAIIENVIRSVGY
jgi:hypothetical protein